VNLALPAEQAELSGVLHRLATGGDAELAVDRDRLGLDRVLGQEKLPADLRKRQVGAQQRQQAQLGGAE
jgi:hypothetical protein